MTIRIEKNIAPMERRGRKPSESTAVWLGLKPGESIVVNAAARYAIYTYAIRHDFRVYIERLEDDDNSYRIFAIGTKPPRKKKS